jgi:hypothetical protein
VSFFTQDLDDMPPKDEAHPTDEPVYMVTNTQLRKLAARMAGYDLPSERVLKYCKQKWGVPSLEELRYEQFQELDMKLEKFAETVKLERAKQPISGDTLKHLMHFFFQHPSDNFVDMIRKVGANSVEQLTYDMLPALYALMESQAERKAIQTEGSSAPPIYVERGGEADQLFELAKQLRTQARYADGSGSGSSGYYQALEEAQNYEAAARKIHADQPTAEAVQSGGTAALISAEEVAS